MWQKLACLVVAGGLGTLARYGLSGLVQRLTAAEFPWGTLVVNVVGCLVFGLLWAVAENRLAIGPSARTVLFVGFFGAFTTFSSFAFETGQLIDASRWLAAGGNILLQNGLGLAGMFAGLALGRWI